MVEFSHPILGSVGRIERTETVEKVEQEDVSMSNNDLQSLLDCGKINDTIEIDGKVFSMSTLSDEDQEFVVRQFSSASAEASSFVELRRTIVAMALETFNGRPFVSLYSGDKTVSIMDKKLSLVCLMQGQVVEKLYSFYEELLKRSKQKVDPEQIKN